MNNVDEIKTVIMLTGAKRIPHLETEIFADKELTKVYLKMLRNSTLWYHGDDEAGCAYWYAKNIICTRWPEAEPLIINDSFWAYYYAKDVVGKRWPEAEPSIKLNKSRWERYSSHFL